MNKLEKKNVKRYSGKDSSRITDECLEEALLELLKTKTIDKVSVTELTNLAGVSRSSFYRRYEEPADILRNITERYVVDLWDSLHNKKYRNDPREWFREIFKLAAKHSEILLTSANAGIPDGNILTGFSLSDDFFVYDDMEDHYRNIAFEYAMKGVIYDWLYYGMKESVDEMTDIVYGIFRDSIFKLFDKVVDDDSSADHKEGQ